MKINIGFLNPKHIYNGALIDYWLFDDHFGFNIFGLFIDIDFVKKDGKNE